MIPGNDYFTFLKEIRCKEEDIRRVVEINSDFIISSEMNLYFDVKASSIEGVGVFARFDMNENTCLGYARINNQRTILGRYVNHQKHAGEANCFVKVQTDDNLLVFTNRLIKLGQEITFDYRQLLTQNPSLNDILLSLKNTILKA